MVRKNPDPRAVRLISEPTLAADLVLGVGLGKSLSQKGLFIKSFNDTLHVTILPGAELTPDNLRQAGSLARGSLMVTDEHSLDADLSTVLLETDRALCRVIIPVAHRFLPLGYSTIEWSRKRSGPVSILRISNFLASPPTHETLAQQTQLKFLGKGEPGSVIELSAGWEMATYCRGDVQLWRLSLICAKCTPPKSHLELLYEEESLSILASPDLVEVTISISTMPIPGENLIAGRRTLGFAPPNLAVCLFDSYGPRLFTLFSSALAGPSHLPLARSPSFGPNRSALLLMPGSSAGDGVLGSAADAAAMEKCRAILVAGNAKPEFLKAIVCMCSYEEVLIVSENRDAVIDALMREQPVESGTSEFIYSNDSRKTMVRVFELNHGSDVAKTFEQIDQAFQDMSIRMSSPTIPSQLQSEFQAQIRDRLPALPFNQDLAVQAVASIGNMLRGRIPSDAASESIDYGAYRSRNLWMSRRRLRHRTRSSLIFQLNARNASEFLAQRCFIDLAKTIKVAAGTCSDHKLGAARLRELCYEWFNRWCTNDVYDETAGGLINGLASAGCRKCRARIVEELSLLSLEACTCTGRYSDRDLGKRNLSFLNPLVIVFAGGGEERYDALLDFNMPFWTMYAGRSNSLQAGGIVASLFHQSEVEPLFGILRELRCHLYSEALDFDLIFELRRELGRSIVKSLEPATFEVIDKLVPSRIVAFSDVPLDFIPYGESLLGLEVPIARIPAKLACLAFNRAVQASSRMNVNHGRPFCCILRAHDETDAVTAWSADVGTSLEELFLVHFGRKCESLAESKSSPDDLLKEASRHQIVIFLGHARASEYWAGLDIGSCHIPLNMVTQQKWTNSFVFLVGCETAAVDTSEGDLSEAFYSGGARCVIGSQTKIPVHVASVFFEVCVSHLVSGSPADYAFFEARRKTVLYEALSTLYDRETAKTKALAAAEKLAKSNFPDCGRFKDVSGLENLELEFVLRNSPTALSLTILGGAGERLI